MGESFRLAACLSGEAGRLGLRTSFTIELFGHGLSIFLTRTIPRLPYHGLPGTSERPPRRRAGRRLPFASKEVHLSMVDSPAAPDNPAVSGGPAALPAGVPAPSVSAPGKVLVIAEKRSVGRTLAQFLGCRSDHGSWIGGERCDVTWAQGHLLRLLMPEEYENRPAWRERGTAALPLVPAVDEWRWQVSRERGASAQYEVVASLLGSGAYSRVVNACDPDREGQCIADLVLEHVGCTLPVDRLWCSSLEDAALAKAFARMKPDAAYRGLYQSAVARSKTDWLVGLNASRLYSSSMRSAQSVGRVRTPTLALVVERDRLIDAFSGKDTFRVRLDLGEGFAVTGDPCANEAEARSRLAAARGQACHIDEVERRRSREGAPTLLNTTGAQKLASERLGMAPDAVDRALQALYEKKLATYPRTDSRYVNAEDGAGLEALIALVADGMHVGERVAKAFARMEHDTAKVVDDGKVEGHGALLPTRQLTAQRMAALEGDERAVAQLLCESLLAAVSPDRVFDKVSVKATCLGNPYTASSSTDVDPGWKRLRTGDASGEEGAAAGEKEPPTRIPDDLTAPCERTVAGGEVRRGRTQPPKRYTDATLLAAMEHADRFVEEEELKAAIKDSTSHSGGIGTPATRAGIISSLVDRGYLQRKGSTLIATQEGRALVDEVDPRLKSAELTARMERDLTAIERDGADPNAFLGGVVGMVEAIVREQGGRGWRTPRPTGEAVGRCPLCGGQVVDTGNEKAPFMCENTRRERRVAPDGTSTYVEVGICTFRLFREYMGAQISAAQAKKLLAGKAVMLKGLRRKDGETVDRQVCLDPEHGFRPRIAVDQSVRVGTCPKCGGKVLDVGNDRVPYLCEHAARTGSASTGDPAGGQVPACDFKLYREYCGKKLTKGDVAALLAGKTAVVKGLVSRRTGEKFTAFVELDAKNGFRPRIVGYPEPASSADLFEERGGSGAKPVSKAKARGGVQDDRQGHLF